MSPIVSVIMPTYNNGKYIENAIESVINQNIDYELLIIDDDSTDDTQKRVQKYLSNQIFYIRNQQNLGVAESRNIGINLAKGKYIAFLDSDDWWKERKIINQIRIIEENKGVLCYTARELFSEKGVKKKKTISVPNTITYSQLLKTNYIACSSVLVRRDIVKKFKMEHDEFHEDYLMWLRILRKYGLAYGLNYPYLNTRLTSDGKSRNKLKTFKMTYGVYRCLGINKIKSIYCVGRHIINSLIRYL